MYNFDNSIYRIIFILLRAGLNWTTIPHADWNECQKILKIEWDAIYKECVRHGVLAIAWDGLLRLVEENVIPSSKLPERRLKIQWGINVKRIEQQYAEQWVIASDIALRYRGAGIRTLVLKGFAISHLYPQPNHRPCGDFDCFLMGQYEFGNLLAERWGASVKRDFYKHSHIRYKGLVVENHQFCTAIRGSRRAKDFERLLQKCLHNCNPVYLGDSVLEAPPDLFNALFLTKHAQGHFLTEGITLRHLCDWAILLKERGELIDWPLFHRICEKYGMRLFSETMTQLSFSVLGIKTEKNVFNEDACRAGQLLSDIIIGSRSIFNSPSSDWWKRGAIIFNIFKDRWKYRLFTDTNVYMEIIRYIVAFCIDRHPRI